MIKLQFIKNYFNPLDPKKLESIMSLKVFIASVLMFTYIAQKHHLYIIPKEHLKVYKH